jgi:hypothetical protein
MVTRVQLVEKFECLDVHDDTVEEIRFLPSAKRKRSATVEVSLYRHWEGKRRILRFLGCANYEILLDADTLHDNAPNNTCSVEASISDEEIASRMRRHKRVWNVSYDKSIDPMHAKEAALPDLVLFRLRMFGGTLEVIAQSFSIRRVAKDRDA